MVSALSTAHCTPQSVSRPNSWRLVFYVDSTTRLSSDQGPCDRTEFAGSTAKKKVNNGQNKIRKKRGEKGKKWNLNFST